MTNDEFGKFRERLNAECEELLLKKGSDYSGMNDRHRNFKEAGASAGVSPLVAWWIFFKKHLDAIATYVREGKVQSEPIQERFKDARNYLDLGAALVKDTEKAVEDAGGISPWTIAKARKELQEGKGISLEDFMAQVAKDALVKDIDNPATSSLSLEQQRDKLVQMYAAEEQRKRRELGL